MYSSPVMSQFAYRYVKRCVDIVIACLALVLLSPFFVVVGILVKLTSSGPIFYTWDVVGHNGLPFRSYKFRSMVSNADELKMHVLDHNEMSGPVFKIHKDPRITPIGKILRKYSIDELPQLWSVFKGDMSLVGPRPAFPHEWEHYEPWQRRRLSVKPGITGLWQVFGRNQIKDFNKWVSLDLEYIDKWSLWLDCKILLRTVLVVYRGTGM